MGNANKMDSFIRTIGRDWHEHGYHRCYINNISELIGLEIETYNSGNIKWGSLAGETVSNTYAGELENECMFGKLYWDYSSQEFKKSPRLSHAVFEMAVNAIYENFEVWKK